MKSFKLFLPDFLMISLDWALLLKCFMSSVLVEFLLIPRALPEVISDSFLKLKVDFVDFIKENSFVAVVLEVVVLGGLNY